ncbi:MAG: DUF3575 domain-containing protein [Prevotellaceae bacterium]|nr:DUF3575 domain-containing protein [Prevotellaceae bacterium]
MTTNACRIIAVLLLTLNITNINSEELPSYIIVIPNDAKPFSVSDSSLWEKALPIYFKVNRTEIRPGDQNLENLTEVLKKTGEEYSLCKLMIIRSSASPEGGYKNNVRLAHRRAKALLDSLKRHIVIPDSTVEERYMHEDYEGLRRMLLKSDAPFRDKAISIIEKNRGNDSETKRQLMNLDAGRTWKVLLRDYYPSLRAARILIFVTRNLDSQFVGMTKETSGVYAPKPIKTEEKLPYISELKLTSRETTQGRNQPMFNLKTNLLYDLALVVPQYGWAPSPNVSLEFLPRYGHITAVAEYIGSGWRNDRKLKTWIVRDLLLEARYYLRGNASFTGHYFAAYANTARYDIQFSAEKAWLSKSYGDTWGTGIGWGYVRRIGKSHWKWEANLALGLLHTAYDRYHPAEEWAEPDRFYYNWHDSPELFVKLRNKFNYIGITRLGFSLSYDLPWLEWKTRKGGGR